MIALHRVSRPLYRLRIGNREVVGPSASAMEEYYDRVETPCPPIRYRPPGPEINALREKEKSDWSSLTIQEKKALYRASFCRTLKEVEAPTCEAKRVFASFLMLICVPILTYVIAKKTVFPPLPESCSDEGRKRLVRWYIEARADPLDGGISSKWDYEKNQWKERPYWLMRSK